MSDRGGAAISFPFTNIFTTEISRRKRRGGGAVGSAKNVDRKC
jgi:hypothetical protein